MGQWEEGGGCVGTFWAFAFAFCWVRQCFAAAAAAAAFNDFAYDTRAKLGSCDSST